jgi:pyridoxal 5'-phosphate synthase pdxS subunit
VAAHESPNGTPPAGTGTDRVKRGMAEQLKGGVIMDVVTPEQAKIAEDAGAVAVMALERVPADIRAEGGISRMSDPDMIEGIIGAVSIPVMAKARIGHFVEAQVLQSLGVDYIDESEVLTPADEAHHIAKREFTVPFVCGATDLGEALRRISEGAAMIRSKGEAGTGNVVEATRHMRSIRAGIKALGTLDETELFVAAKELRAPYDLVVEVARLGKLPVVLFTAGGIATPADAAMMMQLGAEGVFVGSGIFKSGDPATRAAAIVQATTFHDDPDVIAKVSRVRRWSASTCPRSPRASGSPHAAGDPGRVVAVLLGGDGTAIGGQRGTVISAVTPTWSDAQSGGGAVRNGSAPVRATLLTGHPSGTSTRSNRTSSSPASLSRSSAWQQVGPRSAGRAATHASSSTSVRRA